MSNINTNIKVLREEARLSVEEFAERMNVSKETVVNWEKGKQDPTNEQIEQMCPILRIHLEDFLERDIQQERNDAGRRMRKSNTRINYNWYLGDKKIMFFYISYLIIIPLVFFIGYLLSKSTYSEFVNQITDEEVLERIKLYYYLSGLAWVGVVTCIYVLIYLFKKRIINFRWWYLTWITGILAVSVFLGSVAAPFLYVYAFYKGIIKKGKNR